jgi:gamma-glutamyltranspeptidase/glutathione hydrolase
VPVNTTIAYWLSVSAKALHWQTPYSKSLLCTESGEIPTLGYSLPNPDLARTFRLLIDEGLDSIYSGTLARALVETIESGGGIVTSEDLSQYRVVERTPLSYSWGGETIYTNPPPSVGGCSLIQILEVLDDWPLDKLTPAVYVQLAKLFHGIVTDRFSLFSPGSPPPSEADLLSLTDRETVHHKYGRLKPSANTTQLCTADAQGNACSITMSMGYGSGVAIEPYGIFMDNALGELELNPAGFHALPPGQRLVSNMTPTVVLSKSSDNVLAIGTPGASRIATAIGQVLMHHIKRGHSLKQAVGDPRIHWEDGKVLYEPGITLPVDQVPSDWEVVPFEDLNMYFGGIQATACTDGELIACSDPRRAGQAAIAIPSP